MKKGLIRSLILLILSLMNSCSGWTKKMSPPRFEVRTYRFCSPLEVEDPQGKLCYRFCSKKTLVLKKCKETELIIEDLSVLSTYEKFFQTGFLIMKRGTPLKKFN